MSQVSAQQFRQTASGNPLLHGWVPDGDVIAVRYLTGSFMKGLALLQAIAEAAEAANHHPDVTLTYPHLELELTSHDVGHLTERDVDLATTIGQIARDHGVAADSAGLDTD